MAAFDVFLSYAHADRPPRRRAALGLPLTTRRPLANYEVTIRSGLGQLGGGSCRLDDPYNIPIVTVPGHPELVAIRRSSPTPIRLKTMACIGPTSML